MGALLQRTTQVHVAYMGDFLDGDERKTLAQGQAAVLNQPSIISHPRPQVTWFRDGHKIIPNDRIAITLNNQLVILATTTADAGSYYVQAVNEKTGENKTSPFIYLSISSARDSQDLSPPEMVITPHNLSVVSGSSSATFECIANARPIEDLIITWKKNGVNITSRMNDFGRRLTIWNPSADDVGNYLCEAALQNSTAEPARMNVFLSVTEPPYFTTELPRKIVTEVNKNIDLPCQASGVPAPSLVWYKDAQEISMLQDPRYKTLANGSLQIESLHPEDLGIFQCFAKNEAGEIQMQTYLDLTSLAPNFTIPPADTTVTDGMVATFSCEVTGAPKPAITWKKGNQILASGTVQIPRYQLLESGGLQISPVSPHDAGNYTCLAANSVGAVNGSAALTVWTRTFISLPPDDCSVIKGTTATLHCGASHDPRVSIRFAWKKDGIIIDPVSSSRITLQPNGSLSISQTWSGDIGNYTCGITSLGGNDSRAARLEVIELPHSPQNLLAVLDSTNNRAVDLSWVRPFDGNSPILYYVVEVSENNSPWKVHLPDVDPKISSSTVSGLTPARTYQFRICAVNRVGKGQYSTATRR
ncbi:protein sidekick-1-like [Discoglossus pictus]